MLSLTEESGIQHAKNKCAIQGNQVEVSPEGRAFQYPFYEKNIWPKGV